MPDLAPFWHYKSFTARLPWEVVSKNGTLQLCPEGQLFIFSLFFPPPDFPFQCKRCSTARKICCLFFANKYCIALCYPLPYWADSASWILLSVFKSWSQPHRKTLKFLFFLTVTFGRTSKNHGRTVSSCSNIAIEQLLHVGICADDSWNIFVWYILWTSN